jgi:branched-chain amino acid transport system substrate-binding protein
MSMRLVLALAVLGLLSGCAGRATPPPIWIGHVATVSGPDREAGKSAERGILLAVEEFNKDPDQGVCRQIKVVHSDAHGKLDAFEAEAVRLVAINRVSFLLGGNNAEEVERLDRAHVPVLTPTGYHSRGMSDMVYFTGLPPATVGKTLARHAGQELGVGNVLVLQDESRPEAQECVEAFARELPTALGKKDAKSASPAVRKLRFGKDAKLSDLVKTLSEQLGKDSFKAVLFAGRVDDVRELGELPVPLLFAGDEGSSRVLLGQRPVSKDVYLVSAFVVESDTPRAADFVKRYKAAFSEEPDAHAALAYESIKLLYEALCQAKDSLTVARIREELVKLKDHPGLTGALTLGEDRQVHRPAFVVHVAGGAAKAVKRYPAE